ncbi:hypothetical protein ENBRE01_2335 [Enteropsectra breve]|nr:hypothetical protein ENBRE01_2335 [Enteropsectra breve]
MFACLIFTSLCLLFTLASSIPSPESGIISDQRIRQLYETKCYICSKPLLEFEKSSSDNGIYNIIKSSVFYDLALKFCKINGCGAAYHLVCAESLPPNRRKSFSSVATRKAPRPHGKMCRKCNKYVFTHHLYHVVLGLSYVSIDSSLIFSYLRKICLSQNIVYSDLLAMASLKEEDCRIIRDKLLASDFEGKSHFIDSIDLYECVMEQENTSLAAQRQNVDSVIDNSAAANYSRAEFNNNNPISKIEGALIRYLNSLPAELNKSFLITQGKAWMKLKQLLKGTDELPCVIFNILLSINPLCHENFALRMVYDLAEEVNNICFVNFTIRCLLSPYYLVLYPILIHQALSAHYTKPSRFFILLERSLRNYVSVPSPMQTLFLHVITNFISQTYSKECSWDNGITGFYQIKWSFSNKKHNLLVTENSNYLSFKEKNNIYTEESRKLLASIYESNIEAFIRTNAYLQRSSDLYNTIKIFSFYERFYGTQKCNYHPFIKPILNNYPEIERMLSLHGCDYEKRMIRRQLKNK